MFQKNTKNDAFTSHIHSFNLNSLTWNVPNIKGTPPKRRRLINSAFDNTGKMYMFGEYSDELFGKPGPMHFNDMVILDTVRLSWSTSTPDNSLTRSAYTATLLPNGVIVYIGGVE